MKFKTKLADLNKALDVASIIHPSPINSEGGAGRLFAVRDGQGYIYASDDHQKCRVPVAVSDVEGLDEKGEGSFVLPADLSFAYLGGESITFESKVVEGVHVFSYETESGQRTSDSTFDPKLFNTLDKDFGAAKEGPAFPLGLLKEAISVSRPYCLDPNSNGTEAFKSVHILDEEWEKGNGHLLAMNGARGCYFHCPEFEGKAFSIYSPRISFLNTFLAKSKGEVTLHRSENSTYLRNAEGQIVGWSDQAVKFGKFSYHARAKDHHILRIPKETLVRELMNLKSNMKKQVKVRIGYDHEKKTLSLKASTGSRKLVSSLVAVVPLDSSDGTTDNEIHGGEHSKDQDLDFNAHIDHLIELISPLKSHVVDLRIKPPKDASSAPVMRVIENINYNEDGKVVVPSPEEKTYPCRVTRVTAAMR